MEKTDSISSISVGQAMGVDLGDLFSHVCVLDAAAVAVHHGRMPMSQTAVEAYVKSLPRLRVAMEAGTNSSWVARIAEIAGHEVIVANQRRVHLIGQSTRQSDR